MNLLLFLFQKKDSFIIKTSILSNQIEGKIEIFL